MTTPKLPKGYRVTRAKKHKPTIVSEFCAGRTMRGCAIKFKTTLAKVEQAIRRKL